MKRFIKYLLLWVSLSMGETLQAQEQRVNLNLKDVMLRDLIWELQRKTDLIFIYSTSDVESVRLSRVKERNKGVRAILDKYLEGTGLCYDVRHEVFVLRRCDKQPVKMKMRTIRGCVRDEEGVVLPGVTVRLKGSSIGVATDINGCYALRVPKEGRSILVYSFIGMESCEVEITAGATVDVVLRPDCKHLREVIITGYGQYARTGYTGSATVIGSENIGGRSVSSLQDVIRGLSSGTLVGGSGQPGVAYSVLIRGVGSMHASKDPLYVVDGMVWDLMNLSGDDEYPINPLNTINPQDIVNITVLKDAASASLYGSRGANGVIVITTKQGSGNGKTRYTLDAQLGLSSLFSGAKPDLVNADEFTDLWVEGEMHRLVYQQISKNNFFEEVKRLYADKENYLIEGKNYYDWYHIAQQRFNEVFKIKRGDGGYYEDLFGVDRRKLPDVNWYEKVTRLAPFQKINFSMDGGDPAGNYYISLEYLNQQGVIRGSQLKRYSLRVNFASEPAGKSFHWGIKTMLSHSDQRGPRQDAMGYAMPQYTALSLAPVVPVYLEDGSLNLEFPYGQNSNMNPLAVNKYNIYARPQTVVYASGWIRCLLSRSLSFRGTVSLSALMARRRQYYDKDFGDGQKDGGALYERDARRRKIVGTGILYYCPVLGKGHEWSSYTGFELEDVKEEYISARGIRFLSDDFPYLSASAKVSRVGGGGEGYAMFSWLFNSNYTYRQKYYLSVSLRGDRSSCFHPDYRFGFFGSVSAAWRISQERFMQRQDKIQELKLKVSYGSNGCLPQKLYGWRSLYSFGYEYNGKPGLNAETIANKRLTWENNRILNLGVEAVLLNRMHLNLEYYYRVTANLLQDVPLSYVSGYSSRLENTEAGLCNAGIELDVELDLLKKRFWSWGIDFNLATLKNRFFGLKGDYLGLQIQRNGESIYSWYLREWVGVNRQTGEQQWVHVEKNGKKELTTKYSKGLRDVRGSALPKVSGGLTSVLRYKNWEWRCLFTYACGYKVLDYTGFYSTKNDGARNYRNIERDQLDRWTPDNPAGKNPIRINNGWDRYNSTRYLYDGDYLKLKSMKVQYNLPGSWTQKFKIEHAHLFLQAENLFVWTELKGFDPEITLTGYRRPEVYPSATTYTVGLYMVF